MSTTRDFVASTVTDTLLPLFRRSFEDVVYETLDKRQVPTRADFKDFRDLVDGLRGQVSGAVNGVKRLAEDRSEVSAKLDAITARLDAIEARLDKVAAGPAVAARRPPAARATAKKPRATKRVSKATGACQVRGCTGDVRSKGFCSKHYQAWRRGRLEGFPFRE
jgi:hypothetical protein